MYDCVFVSYPLISSLADTRTALIGVDLLTRDDRGLYALEKDSTTLSRFLNRLLGLPVGLQNQLFAYFTDTLASIIKQAKRAGSWDGGIRGGESTLHFSLFYYHTYMYHTMVQ